LDLPCKLPFGKIDGSTYEKYDTHGISILGKKDFGGAFLPY
jgi:hypothetical protein